MMVNWTELRASMKKGGAIFARTNKDMVTAFQGLNAAANGCTELDVKTRELISLACAVTSQCDGCIGAHVRAAHTAGATEREVSEALSAAVAMRADGAFVHSLKALVAFEDLARPSELGGRS